MDKEMNWDSALERHEDRVNNEVKKQNKTDIVMCHENQEPVAWASFDNAYSKACNSSNPQDWMEAALLAQQIRTSPVRTKDLTNDEIDEIESEILMGGGEYIDVIRAVIAADREKNK